MTINGVVGANASGDNKQNEDKDEIIQTDGQSAQQLFSCGMGLTYELVFFLNLASNVD